MDEIIDKVLDAEKKAQEIINNARVKASELKSKAETDITLKISKAKEQAQAMFHENIEKFKNQAEEKLKQEIEKEEKESSFFVDRNASRIEKIAGEILEIITSAEFEGR